MRYLPAVVVLTFAVACGWFVWAQEAEKAPAFEERLPPCVVKTVPDDRAMDVDPDLREIKVTYDRPMDKTSMSWIIHRNLGVYPGSRDLGPPHFEDDGRTCVLPVRLQRGTVYAVGVNSFRHTNFRDAKGHIAVPHVWVFRTREH